MKISAAKQFDTTKTIKANHGPNRRGRSGKNFLLHKNLSEIQINHNIQNYRAIIMIKTQFENLKHIMISIDSLSP